MSIHLSLSDVPTHVVLWQEKEKLTQLVESLVQRIGTLEASVTSLLTKTKKDTPLLSGIDTRRGVPPLNIVQEADPRNLLKELIETAPLPGLSALPGLPGLPGNMYEVTNGDSNIKVVQVSDTKNTIPTPLIYTSMLDNSERCYVEAKNEERTRRKRDMFGSQASSTVATETTQNSEDEEIEIEEEQEQADAEEEQQEVEEEVDADAEEDAEQEEEAQQEELTEFEFKGVTYWRDSENQVYKVDDDGDLDDTPIGLWSSEKNKILKFQTV
jgi:hypothetical protein